MTEDELFSKAWLFVYAAAGKNIGFDVKPVEDFRRDDPEDHEGQTA